MSLFQHPHKKWLWVLAWVIATAAIYFCVRQIDWDKALTEWTSVHGGWLLLAALADLSVLGFWALQWRVFLPKGYHVHFGRMLEINALIAMTANTLPFLAGHALGIVLLAKREKTGTPVALSVMALDQLAEGFAKLSLFILVAAFTPLPGWMKTGILAACAVIFLFTTLLFFCAFRYRQLKRFMRSHSSPRWKKLWHFISRWGHHLEALRSWKVFAVGLLLALLMKGGEVGLVYCVQKSFGLDLPIWTALFVMAGVSLATMVPVSPGNLGIYEATVFFIYQFLGLSPELSLGLALFQHILYLLPKFVVGYGILLFRNFYPAPVPATTPAE